MDTNVQKNSNQIPAGIISGTEAFWHEDRKWVIHEGECKPFEMHPGKIQRMIANAFLDDTESRDYLRRIGITVFSEAFDRWFKCVIGGLDAIPDLDSKGLHPDAFVNTCQDNNCPHRGRLCGRLSGLKNFEVKTIKVMESGSTIEKSADILCIAIPSLKSRIERIKEKFNVSNMASMIARSAQLGIL